MLQITNVLCPYCGQSFETTVDCLAGNQQYIEDCPVCCRPIEFDAVIGQEFTIDALVLKRDDE